MTFSSDSVTEARRPTRRTKSAYGKGETRSFNLPRVAIEWLESRGAGDKLREMIEDDPDFIQYAKERGF